jgi:hypothetical protein
MYVHPQNTRLLAPERMNFEVISDIAFSRYFRRSIDANCVMTFYLPQERSKFEKFGRGLTFPSLPLQRFP